MHATESSDEWACLPKSNFSFYVPSCSKIKDSKGLKVLRVSNTGEAGNMHTHRQRSQQVKAKSISQAKKEIRDNCKELPI